MTMDPECPGEEKIGPDSATGAPGDSATAAPGDSATGAPGDSTHADPQALFGLNLSQAEPLTPTTDRAAACASCQRSLRESYYEVNSHAWCPACHGILHERMFRKAGWPGRVLRSVVLGGLAALVGAIIYYAIAAATGYEFGLIGIFIGLGVGLAVQRGSQGRGGRSYQALAMALTYLAIVSTYAPAIWKGMAKGAEAKQAPATPAATTPPPASEPSAAGAPAPPKAAAPPADKRPAMPLFIAVPLFLIFFTALVLASPWLAGFQNIMGWFIIGISLYEAWKINRRPLLVVRGPFTLAPASADPPAHDS